MDFFRRILRTQAMLQPQRVNLKLTEFEQRRKAALRKAKGRTVVVLTAKTEKDEKCVLDRVYFEEILREMRAMRPTRRPPEALRADPRDCSNPPGRYLTCKMAGTENGATRITKPTWTRATEFLHGTRWLYGQARSSDGQAASRSRPRWLD